MSERESYRKLCAIEPTIPLFARDWWLDAVCGRDNWDVVLMRENGQVLGTLPFVRQTQFGLTRLNQPPLTPSLGPWIRKSQGKLSRATASAKHVMNGLIEQLPQFDHFSQNWHHSQGNWLPFYWAGYRQTTRYTYLLSLLHDESVLWEGLQENIRREIRKASGRERLTMRDDLPIEDFLELNRLTFRRQGLNLPYSTELVGRIERACNEHSCRKIWIAQDESGRQHAGVFIVWDENSAYYLMGGGDPAYRNSGATSLCMWTAILHSRTVTRQFDFEGSMIEPVERFFRAFGAVQTPYFNLQKTPSRLLRLHHAAKTVWKGN